MPARSPEEVQRFWGEYFNAGDIDRLVGLYEANALLMPQPGQTVTGQAAIREALQNFLATGLKIDMQFEKSPEAGGLALLFSRWALAAPGSEKEPAMIGQTSDVVRRQPDGTWLIVIDNPFGGAGVEPPA